MAGQKGLKFILLLSFIVVLFGIWADTGCSRKMTQTGSDFNKTWVCSDDADRAMKLHNYQAAILLHEKLLEKDPTNALALYHLGYAFGQIGDHEKEVFHYKKAIVLGFHTDQIFLNLGLAYGELNEIEKSIMAFKKSLKINPESPDSHFGLAMAYFRQGMADKLAEEEFLKTIDIDPRHIESRLYLSILYADRGELQKAGRQLKKILQIDPTNERARNLLEKIEKE
jgi:tetratricopeptide (TPR) repeat protein